MESGDHGRVVKGVIESISRKATSTDDFTQHFSYFLCIFRIHSDTCFMSAAVHPRTLL